MNNHEERTYRSLVEDKALKTYRVVVQETDLLIKTETPLRQEAQDLILKHRLPLERYIQERPEFLNGLEPFPTDPFAPAIVRAMIEASQKAHVGPMAAVAGAIAEFVGTDLKALSGEVIVENGGDVFLHTATPQTVAVFAGTSPLSHKIGIRIDPSRTPMGICTSSGTIGHSLSLGKADAVVVLSESTSLADAAATAIGNLVSPKEDLSRAIAFGRSIDGVQAMVIVVEERLGTWGDVELVRI